MSSSSARGRRDSRPPSMPPRRGSTCWSLESSSPGGQAGSSSRIENYLGFPTGISGQELAARAYTQSQKFGAQLMIAKPATRLACNRKPHAIELDDGTRVPARAVIIATGAAVSQAGAGERGAVRGRRRVLRRDLHGGAAVPGEEVVVVGGGNSAGQAAVFLAQTASRVHMLVRSGGLAETHVAVSRSGASRRARRSSCAATPSSPRSKGTGISSACPGGTVRPA